MKFPNQASPCVALRSRFFPDHAVWVKRDDLLHPQVSGNKFRKLKYPLSALQDSDATIVTMGGIWSNHVHATAHAAALGGWKSMALIRGDEHSNSAMLEDCRALGMQLIFVERDAYRQLRAEKDAWRRFVSNSLPTTMENAVWLPEGGSAPEALHGVAEMVDELIAELAFVPDTIAVACGTGATLAGILAGLQGRGQVLGIAVLKNADYLRDEIAHLLQQAGYPAYDNYRLLTGFHHGGYAKAPPNLIQFCAEFSAETHIPIEPVYTGKLFYALHQLALAGQLPTQQKIVAVHTGGLQGARGFAPNISTAHKFGA